MAQKRRILVVDDFPEIRKLLAIALVDYEVDLAATYPSALAESRHQNHAAFIVDIALSSGGQEGLELIAAMRRECDERPIIAMSGQTDAFLPANCYRAGADGFLPKPFRSLVEVSELLRRLMTRTVPGAPKRVDGVYLPAAEFTFAGALIRPDLTIRFPNGTVRDLSPKEVGVLHFFVSHAGALVKRSELLAHVWGPMADPTSKSIDTHLVNLRKYYREQGIDLSEIVTVRPKVGWWITAVAAETV